MSGGSRSTVARVATRPLVLQLALVAVVAALVAWRFDWSALDLVLHPASWGLLLAAILSNFVSVWCKGFAWKAVVDGLPSLSRPTRIRDLISPLFIGFLFNTVLAARLGEVVRIMLVRRRLANRGQRVSAASLLGTVVAENLIATIVWVLVVVGIGIFLPLPFYAWVASIGLGLACLVVVILATFTATGHHLPEWMAGSSHAARIGRTVRRLWGAVQESHVGLRNPVLLARVGGASLGSWIAQWAGILFALHAFDLGYVGLGGAGLLLVTVTLAQAFPLLPGNLLVFQAAVVVPLTASYGVAAAPALAFSVILQFTEAVVGVVVGFGFLLAEGMSFGELRRDAEQEAHLSSS
ncbi:MAG: flippase-like domain-containing protein [Actinobacteria bacterium]|nr:flippase-like domain-containing protein [Actinomycetota bacterium]